jgi:hypothetical protein
VHGVWSTSGENRQLTVVAAAAAASASSWCLVIHFSDVGKETCCLSGSVPGMYDKRAATRGSYRKSRSVESVVKGEVCVVRERCKLS